MATSSDQTHVIRSWTTKRDNKKKKLSSVASMMKGKFLPTNRIIDAFHALIEPGDTVIMEGVQKQADFLSRSLAQVDPKKIHGLEMVLHAIERPDHISIFEDGIASTLDFSFAGPQSRKVAELLSKGVIKVRSMNTYVELSARLFVDLIPKVALVCADAADAEGNLYTGANTEDTPSIIEATSFSNGIVIVQVNEIMDKLPRIDIPGGWVDVIVQADRPFEMEPIQTRDPKDISELQILMAMMAIRGIYEKHNVISLNHGVGFNTASIELLLPTYAAKLGLKGKICRNWVLNPQPTLIPAIESGWVESVHSFGNEDGMQEYIKARPDIFFTGPDGSLRSNRVFCQLAGHYAIDLFAGSTLQIDPAGNTSTVTKGRIAGFGGAPNLGGDARGRRHSSPAWLSTMDTTSSTAHGHKLCVQMVETFKASGVPTFVENLDAIEVGKEANLPCAPIMVYAEDVTHIVTEQGIAYVYKAQSLEERRAAIGAVAGVTNLGLSANPKKTAELRRSGVVAYPEDLGIARSEAKRSLLAAKNMKDLVEWSGGLYEPPARFRNW
ncbi:MAG: malonate decarboxylase subunit alpha [Porticoccaceae bacterium]